MRSIIPEYIERGKYYGALLTRSDIFVVLLIILVGFASFGLGFLAAQDTQSVTIERPHGFEFGTGDQGGSSRSGVAERASESAAAAASGELVGSVNSDKYHFPWCSGAQRIAQDNKIWFDDAADARARGYTAAANCKGLQ